MEGPLGNFTNARFQATFGCRDTGRVHILKVLSALIRAPTEDEMESFIRMLGSYVGNTFAVSGVGSTGEQRGRTVRLSVVKNIDGKLCIDICEDSERSTHFEDMEVTCQSHRALITYGGCIEVFATDSDIWQMLLAYADWEQLQGNDRPTSSKIFVRIAQVLVVVEGKEIQEEILRVDDLALKIRFDPRCIQALIPVEFRVLNIVTAMLLLGSDMTSTIVGMSHKRGLTLFMENLMYIGCLVIHANAEQKLLGWVNVIDLVAAQRFFKVIYGNRDPMAFADLSKGITRDAWGRMFDELSWLDCQKRVAKRDPTKFERYIPSENNIEQHIMRAQSRLHSVVCAKDRIPNRPPLVGYVVTGEKNGCIADFVAPRVVDLLGLNIKNVLPLLFPSPLLHVYAFECSSTNSALVDSVRRNSRTSSSTSLCSRCKHSVHRNRICEDCGSDPCSAVCSRCGHEPHEGALCQLCLNTVSGTSMLCALICLVPGCHHPGKRSQHSKVGCKECGANEGCNAISQVRQAEVVAAADLSSEDAAIDLADDMNEAVNERDDGCAHDEQSDSDDDNEDDTVNLATMRSIVSALSEHRDNESSSIFDAAITAATDTDQGPDMERTVERYLGIITDDP